MCTNMPLMCPITGEAGRCAGDELHCAGQTVSARRGVRARALRLQGEPSNHTQVIKYKFE
jgi:hypothetical protein